MDYEDFAQALSMQIRVELTERSQRQADLAEALGIHSSTLNLYIKGHRNFPIALVAKAARHFGMPASELIGRAEDRAARGIRQKEDAEKPARE